MRKKYKELKREYSEILKKQKALEARIINKAYEMVQRVPNIPITYLDKEYTVKELLNYLTTLEVNEINKTSIGEYLHIIKTIEDYNNSIFKYKQLSIFDQRKGISNNP